MTSFYNGENHLLQTLCISDAMCEEWGLKPEHIWIRFEDTRMEDWFTGPNSAAEKNAQ